jgi:hypothetical protein
MHMHLAFDWFRFLRVSRFVCRLSNCFVFCVLSKMDFVFLCCYVFMFLCFYVFMFCVLSSVICKRWSNCFEYFGWFLVTLLLLWIFRWLCMIYSVASQFFSNQRTQRKHRQDQHCLSFARLLIFICFLSILLVSILLLSTLLFLSTLFLTVLVRFLRG